MKNHRGFLLDGPSTLPTQPFYQIHIEHQLSFTLIFLNQTEKWKTSEVILRGRPILFAIVILTH